ncbi:MAG: helix-turn-helix transcriptional regulator [Muribaculaceae bacterium]|nr:helix-turn-helix transcriptional regulator [Muribaculaceae bacterium]
MYNGGIINELLVSQKKKAKDLLSYLGANTNGSLTQIVKGNPSADRIEKIADFFGVSIDTFFVRESPYAGINVNGNSNVVASIQIGQLDAKAKSLQAMIEEKDKRIALLEEMIEVLKNK